MALPHLALDRILKLRPKLRGAILILVTERLEQVNAPDVEEILFGRAGRDPTWNEHTANEAATRFEAWGCALGLVCRLPWLKGDRFASVSEDALDLICASQGDPLVERKAQIKRLLELARGGEVKVTPLVLVCRCQGFKVTPGCPVHGRPGVAGR